LALLFFLFFLKDLLNHLRESDQGEGQWERENPEADSSQGVEPDARLHPRTNPEIMT